MKVAEEEELFKQIEEKNPKKRAAIQGRGSISMDRNFSVYGVDTIAIDLSLSVIVTT
jgi:hypothetical protein